MGRAIAQQLAASGCRVGVVARRIERLEELASEYPGQIFPFQHDVINREESPALFATITKELGGLDLFVYSSGIMPEIGQHDYPIDADLETIDVNVAGAVVWINLAAQRMDNTRHGSLVAISSVAGERGRFARPVYNASKAFLNCYMEAIRNRIARYGVKVVTVKPGPVDTEMTAGLNMGGLMDASEAARKILKLSRKTGEHFLKPTHALAFFVIRNLPSWLFRRLKI